MSISCLSSELPEDCRFYAADTKEDLHKVIITCFLSGSWLQKDLAFPFITLIFHVHYSFKCKLWNLFLLQFMWLFKEQHLSSPHWRSQRPYVMSQEVSANPSILPMLINLLSLLTNIWCHWFIASNFSCKFYGWSWLVAFLQYKLYGGRLNETLIRWIVFLSAKVILIPVP